MAKRKKRPGASTSRRGKARKAVTKGAAKRATSKKAKKSAKTASKRLMKKPRSGIAKAQARKRKKAPAPTAMVETEIIDVIEKPVPGVVTITEFESERLILPDSENEKGDD